jgi:hypothetical protein
VSQIAAVGLLDLSGAVFDLRDEAGQQQCGVVQQEEGVRVFAYDAPGLVPVLSAQGLAFGFTWRRSWPSAENGVVSPESSEVGIEEFAGEDWRSGGRWLGEEALVSSDYALLAPAAPPNGIPAEAEQPFRCDLSDEEIEKFNSFIILHVFLFGFNLFFLSF